MRSRVMSATLLILLGIGCGTAQAIPAPIVIDFGTGNSVSAGSVLVNGPNISGTGIPLDTLGVTGAPANNGSYDTVGSVAHPFDPDSGNSAALSFDTDPGNNFIKVVGGVPTLGIADGTTLLQGTFASFDLSFPLTALIALSGSGADYKSPLLLSALGLPSNTDFSFFGFVLSQTKGDGSGTAFSVDIGNTGVVTPEPASLLLLGTGIGLVFLGRRFKEYKLA